MSTPEEEMSLWQSLQGLRFMELIQKYIRFFLIQLNIHEHIFFHGNICFHIYSAVNIAFKKQIVVGWFTCQSVSSGLSGRLLARITHSQQSKVEARHWQKLLPVSSLSVSLCLFSYTKKLPTHKNTFEDRRSFKGSSQILFI